MEQFRFVILGAGGIANRFAAAAALVDGCEVCAVASKSLDRARDFAQRYSLARYYGDYAQMLDAERPDCAYIAVTCNDHCRLTMLCLARGIPVLCEKAMFQNSAEAAAVYQMAEKNHVFVMEAMWSRFLPAIQQARRWLEEDRIGMPEFIRTSIGFAAPEGDENRYFNPRLGGGAAMDITVYAYELTTYLLNQRAKRITASAVWSKTGVDVNNHISIEFEHTLADLMTTFLLNIDEQMILYGKKGRIVVPRPHFASECSLYDAQGNQIEFFQDQQTQNGFTYEIAEAICCIRAGKQESDVVPWKDTLACAQLFDQIWQTRHGS